MKWVAFFRNVNLGQPKSPTRAQLEAAFREAGAEAAASFMSNGTLLFSVARGARALAVTRRAGVILSRVCGLHEPGFVCDFRRLAAWVAEDPFADLPAAASERCFSIFAPGAAAGLELPLVAARADCVVFRIDTDAAFSYTRIIAGQAGYPTPVLEKALHQPVTTRG